MGTVVKSRIGYGKYNRCSSDQDRSWRGVCQYVAVIVEETDSLGGEGVRRFSDFILFLFCVCKQAEY